MDSPIFNERWRVRLSTIRILVVDDFEPWRRFVSSMVQKETDLEIVGEVSNGIEAVQKARKLKPDLILLDIVLPKLNGIDVARELRNFAPKTKILFVSQESSPDVVRDALRIGEGFVVKADAGKELLSAVKAIISGEQFLSSRLEGHASSEAAEVLPAHCTEYYCG
jgi:DNA-binding NarL/FixJ family response regulator